MNYAPPFFEVSAQLIPVLFLAMVVEERLQPAEEEGPRDRVFRSWVLACLASGEVLAMSVVGGGVDGSKSVGALIAICMLGACFLIVLPPITKLLHGASSRGERVGHGLAGLFVVALVLLMVLVVNL